MQLFSAVQATARSPDQSVELARQFSAVVQMLLVVVPMNSILVVSDTVMADVDDEDEKRQLEASTSGQCGKLCRSASSSASQCLIKSSDCWSVTIQKQHK